LACLKASGVGIDTGRAQKRRIQYLDVHALKYGRAFALEKIWFRKPWFSTLKRVPSEHYFKEKKY
jgi:hypothetical protein